MGIQSFLNYFTNTAIRQMRSPDLAAEGSRDTAYGANMVPGSNLMNPNPSRDAFNSLFGGTSDWVQKILPNALPQAGVAALPMLGRAMGGQTGGAAGSALGNVGLAAAQGFENPIQDLSALNSLVNLGRRLF